MSQHTTNRTTADTASAGIHHAIHWFEIPARDLDRSAAFYEQLLGVRLKRESLGGPGMAIFPAHEREGVAGCLIQADATSASAPAPTSASGGTLVYLNAGPVLDTVLARVEQAGGRILTPRTELPADIGCFAHIADPDGQRIGLHAPR